MNEALSKRLAFDYGTVAVHEVPRVKEIAAQVRKLTVDIGRNGWHIGDKFRRAKEMIEHGHFEAWLSAECDGYSIRTAQNLMRLREAYDSPEKITFSQTAAMILAQPGVPEEAREAARKAVAEGKTITKAAARKIADESKPQKPKETRAAEVVPKNETGFVFDPPPGPTAPVVIETTARTVPEEPPREPDALSLLSVLTPIPGRLRKVGESVDGGAFDGKAAGQHVECVVAMLHGETPKFVLVAPGELAAKASGVRAADVAMPPALDSPECRKALDEWIEHKRLRKPAYKSVSQVEKLVQKLADLGSDGFVRAVNHSIGMNYAGLFPEAASGNGRSKTPRQPGAGERFDPDHVGTF